MELQHGCGANRHRFLTERRRRSSYRTCCHQCQRGQSRHCAAGGCDRAANACNVERSAVDAKLGVLCRTRQDPIWH